MNIILLKTGLRDALRRPWLTLLLVLSVALGVGVVVAIDLANDSAARAFNLSTEAVIGKATHQIVGGPSGIDEKVYRDLRVTYGYRLSAPIEDGHATDRRVSAQSHGVQPARANGRHVFDLQHGDVLGRAAASGAGHHALP